MERLTKRDESGCLNYPWEFNGVNGSYDILDEDLLAKQIDRLAAYEDTGLEPEEIYEVRFLIAAQRDPQKLARLRDLVLAEEGGRLVVLDEPRKPLVWGDDNHDTILCPSCGHDLMGGFPEAESSEIPMHQCPYCGQPIDGTRTLTREEAEAALKGGADHA